MRTMATERPRYFAYLLRLWCVNTNGEVVWRASLEDSHAGERRGFANLDQLFEFLQELTLELNRGKADVVDSYPRSSDHHEDE